MERTGALAIKLEEEESGSKRKEEEEEEGIVGEMKVRDKLVLRNGKDAKGKEWKEREARRKEEKGEEGKRMMGIRI